MTGHYHLSGIAGVGMSALAEALLDAGADVTGSDRLVDAGRETPTVRRLRAQGIRIAPQDGSGLGHDTVALVVSTAIESANPDIARARELGVPVRHRAEVLAALLEGRALVAVAGTCGKSTTAAMLGTILEGCGADPAVVNGAGVVAWRSERRTGAVRRGTGPCVAEVDESDRSLLRFHPAHAILTNASADHFPIEETLALFAQFRGQVAGVVVDGVAGDATPPRFERIPWGSRFAWEGAEYTIPVPGLHNGLNAWQAVRMALALGYAPERVVAALAAFRGVDRRLERVGVSPRGATVVDDYAHNTEKLRAAWTALRAEAAPGGRVVGLWRPHGYGPLRHMLDDLAAMFAETLGPHDLLYLLPVYDAGGTADRTIQSDALVAALHERGVRGAALLRDHAEATATMAAEAGPGDILATFGARDPELPETARRLAAQDQTHP